MNRDMDVIEKARNTIERAKRMQTQLVSAANVALNEAALVSVRAHAQE